MPTTTVSPEELARRGGEMFDRIVSPNLRPEDDGKFVAIDIETGNYEIDEDDYTAVDRLRGARTISRHLAYACGLPGDLPHRSLPMIKGKVNARHEAVV